MAKNFAWNMSVVYNLPYTLRLGITPSVTVPDYETIFHNTESQLATMSNYEMADKILRDIATKFDK